MMKKILLAPAVLLSAILLHSQPTDTKAKLVQTVTTNGAGKLVIPFQKYVLPNGLTLIVSEDHSDPIVHVDVTYHVGSARETEGRSGFAHFFEHMMFQGSGHVADEQHFSLINSAGGTLNGSTTDDRTNYFETVPSNYLSLALWLESDRMGFLLDSVTQKKFEVQRSTVKNERGQRYDNAPYGLVWEKIGQAMYPEGHPYSWQTIGYIEDLNRVDVNDLRNFFMRWYGPNNATLTVAGDVKTADVVALVEKYFGPIQRGPEVKNMAKMPVMLSSDRCISYEDNVRFPQLTIAFPGVCTWDPDEPALDALCSILSDNKSSVFYETFVKSQVANSASMFSSTEELAGYIAMNIRVFPGHTPHEADSLVNVALAKFEKRGVTDEDLKRYKLYVEGYLLDQLTTVNGKARMLAAYNTFQGEANLIAKDLDRYQKVTKEDVMRVYNKYIKNKPAVVLTVYPKGHPELKARPDNFTPPQYKVGGSESDEYKNLKYNRPVDNFDRGVIPVAGPTPSVHVPGLWKDNFANGLQLIGTQSNEIPRTYMMLNISAGHRQEDTAQAGVAYLLVKMLDQSTNKRSAEDMEKQLDLLGSQVSISLTDDEIQVTITSLTRNLDATLALVQEKLFDPKFAPDEFDLVKKQQMEGIANMYTQAGAMAGFIFSREIYGSDNIMGIPRTGTASTVARLTVDDVKAYYKKMFLPNISRFITVSDLPKEKFEPKLTFLKNWAKGDVKLKTDADLLPKFQAAATKIYFFDKPGAAQSEIRIGFLGMPAQPLGDQYRASMMNYPLGGNFNSRLNLVLREDKGWTYGAGAYFGGSQFTGTYVAYAGVRSDATDSSVAVFMQYIGDYSANGVKPDELDFTKKSVSQKEALKYEDPYQKLYFMKAIIDYSLPDNYGEQQNKILQSLTKPEIDALAKKWLDAKHMAIVVVGDKASLGTKMAMLGYEVDEMDANGNVKGQITVPKVDNTPPPPPPPPGNSGKRKPR